MKRGFTLIELLVVVGIMGLLGTISVGGYRQMQRGMEESGVVDNVTKFVQLTSERAMIERCPTACFFWNEIIRAETEDEPAVVVGKVVAVRQRGRITKKDGQVLIDEFGDLEPLDDEGEYLEAATKPLPLKLYLFGNGASKAGSISGNSSGSSGLKYSVVRDRTQTRSGNTSGGFKENYMSVQCLNENGLSGDGYTISGDDTADGKMLQFGYYVEDWGTASASDWCIGAAYALEFQTLTLPHNYIFESSYPSSMSSPIKEVKVLKFDAETSGSTGGNVGSATISVYALRPGQSGSLTAQKVGTTKKPDSQLNN